LAAEEVEEPEGKSQKECLGVVAIAFVVIAVLMLLL